jgi:hypothetical protein
MRKGLQHRFLEVKPAEKPGAFAIKKEHQYEIK